MQTIFDENGLFNVAEIVTNHPIYKSIMRDGYVSDDELKRQAEATIAAFKVVSKMCSPEQQAAISEAITQLNILYAAYHQYQLQEIKL